MTWVKIDDGFVDHPKIIGLKDRAFRVHLSAMCYAARYPSQRGILPAAALRQIGATRAIASELISAGVWDESADGVSIHDFIEYNPPPPPDLAAKRAEAGRIGGIKSAHTRASKALANHEATPKQLAWQANQPPSPSPSPSPIPLAIVSNEPIAAAALEEPGVREIAEDILRYFDGDRTRRYDPGFIDECYAFARQFPGRHSDVAAAMQAVRNDNKRPFPGNLRPHMPGWKPERSSSNDRNIEPVFPDGGTYGLVGRPARAGAPSEFVDSRTGLLLDPELIRANRALHAQLAERDRKREAAEHDARPDSPAQSAG